MAEKIEDLVLQFNCIDGVIYGNRRFLEVHSDAIKSLEESTGEKAQFIDIPCRKCEVKAIFDIIDNRYADIKNHQNQINYQEFLKVVDWFDFSGRFSIFYIDAMFFSGVPNEQSFYTKCKKCYEEMTSEELDGTKFYNKLPEIFKSLGHD